MERLGRRVQSTSTRRQDDGKSRQNRSRSRYSGRRHRSQTRHDGDRRGENHHSRRNSSSRGSKDTKRSRTAEGFKNKEPTQPASRHDDNQSESDYEEASLTTPKNRGEKSKVHEIITLDETRPEPATEVTNRSADNEEADMVMDTWDVPPTYNPPDSTSDTSTDEAEDELLMQALVDKVVATVRADFKKIKKQEKKKRKKEKDEKKNRN